MHQHKKKNFSYINYTLKLGKFSDQDQEMYHWRIKKQTCESELVFDANFLIFNATDKCWPELKEYGLMP